MKNWFLWNEVLEKTLESPLDSTRSNQSILEEINPEYSLEVLMLKMKLQHFGHLMQRVRSLEKDPDAGKDRRQKEKRAAEDKMVRLHHWLNRHESEQTLGDGEGQGSQVCCSPWNCSQIQLSYWTTPWSRSIFQTTWLPSVSLCLMLDSTSLTLSPFFDHDSSTPLGLFCL